MNWRPSTSTWQAQREGSATVLYIVGFYRSGTTLLDNILGQVDGLISVGELRALWREANVPGSLCGCGTPIRSCPFWADILTSLVERVYPGGSCASFAQETYALQSAALGVRHGWLHVPRLLYEARRRRGQAGLGASYGGRLQALYQTIAAKTRASTIVDSSKEPADAALVMAMPGITTYMVHLIRDPRGAVFSHLRSHDAPTAQLTTSTASSAKLAVRAGYFTASWMATNLMASTVSRVAGPDRAILVRYEDLVRRPEEVIRQILELIGKSLPDGLIDGQHVSLGQTHSVDGNDNRFQTGHIELREDTAWRRSLGRRERTIVETVSAPLRGRYGY